MLRLVLDMTDAEIDRLVSDQIEEIDRHTLEQFKLVLSRALEIQRAKMRPEGYNDDTGQLRSSTGGIIYKDGKVLHEDFKLSPYGTDKSPGLKEGKDKAYAELRETTGWGITIVAGMEYASWVETKHGLSVLEDAGSDIDKNLLRLGLEKTLGQAFNETSV